MRLLCLLLMAVFLSLAQISWAQVPEDLPRVEVPGQPSDRKLPNGKSQREEMVKADYKSNLRDVAELARLSEELKDELDKSGSNTVSVKTLKKLDDIEKLAKNIRNRLRRY